MNQRLTESPSWHALQAHYEKMKDIQLRQLFAGDPNRGDRLVAKAAGLYLDYSKNRITDETVRLLIQLAKSGASLTAATQCFAARRSTSRKTAQCCTLHCGLHEGLRSR